MKIAQEARRLGSKRREQTGKHSSLLWTGADYPRLGPGKYEVRGVGWQGPDWLRAYSRWSIRVEFALTLDAQCISAFFNLESNPDHPQIGKQSRYFKAWTMANRSLPKKGEQMSPEVFLEGQFFEVTVADSKLNSDRVEKSDAEIYSRIVKFHSARLP